ncbi:MAG: SCO family protein [Chloroflexi bacterium]|nr:SCO family protein [Chloroflexota bacterium]
MNLLRGGAIRTLVGLLAGFGVIGALALAAFAKLDAGGGAALDDFGAAPAFALVDQAERPASSAEFRGKVVVANFIYTSCTDICPLLSVRMQALQDRLRQENLLGTEVQLLSFTVDPTRDTPVVLRAYAERHGADPSAWRFLTGSQEQIIPLIEEGFHLGVEALPPTPGTEEGGHHGSYEVMHSGRFVLMDREWRIRAYLDGRDLDLDRIVRDIRSL